MTKQKELWEAYYRSGEGCEPCRKKNSFITANFGKFPTKDTVNSTRYTQNDISENYELFW